MESLVEKVERKERRQRKWRKIRNISLLFVFIGLIIFGAVYFYYPFAKGVKSGQLNDFAYKGYLFKTYEGKLIQTGFRPNQGGMQSNEFLFSVSNEKVAKELERVGGKTVELHYIEYFGALPWRGFSRYVVDSIISISEYREEIVPNNIVLPTEEI